MIKKNEIKNNNNKQKTNKIVESKNKFNINIIDKTNKIIDNIKLNEKVWGTSASSELISFVVVAEQSAKRQGTKKVKERGEVSGSGKKPWKQKGTGRARAGSIRSPIWRGGGITFGPTGKENYVKKVNKKVHRKALLGCLNQVFFNDRLIILKEFNLKKPSTSEIKKISNNLNIIKSKKLFVIDFEDKNLYLSLRNVKNYKVVSFDNLTIFDLLNVDKVIIFEKMLRKIEERLNK